MADTFGSEPWRAARGAILAVAAVVFMFGAGLAARADDGATVARRMDDRLYFVQSLGRGWEPLLRDFETALESVAQTDREAVLRVRDTAMEHYADLRLVDNTEAGERRAFELYEALSREAVDTVRRPEFARKCATIEVAWARRLADKGDDQPARALALSALKRSPGFEPAHDLLASIALRQARKAASAEDFVTALSILEESAPALPAGSNARGQLDAERSRILSTTGEIAVQWLGSAERMARVRGPKTDFTSATLELRSVEGKPAPPPQRVGRRMRVRNGRYDVTARGSGPSVFPAGGLDVTSAGATVTLVVALPQNMVVVPATGGQDAFLIDRTEVTVSELRSPGGGNVGGDRTAATGVKPSDARAYVQSSGKDLPTKEQWLIAAFGNPSGTPPPRYPWGDAPPQAMRNFVGGVDSPASVDSCPEGASRFGCLNMAGNVMEWLATDEFIGGSFKRDSLTYEVGPKDESGGQPWTADFLRMPVPSHEKYDSMSPADRGRYWNYRAKEDLSTYEQVGLRCVVTLGKPRSQP